MIPYAAVTLLLLYAYTYKFQLNHNNHTVRSLDVTAQTMSVSNNFWTCSLQVHTSVHKL